MSEKEVSIYRTIATIEAEEEALRYCPGCGGTFAELHFGPYNLCAECRGENDSANWVDWVNTDNLDVNHAAIVELIRRHRAEFDQIRTDIAAKRI